MVATPSPATLDRTIHRLQMEARNCHATIATLQEKLDRYSSLLDTAHDLIHSITPQGTFLFVNRAWREILGYNPQEIPGLSLLDIVEESHQDQYHNIFNRMIQGEAIDRHETIFMSKDGRQIPVEGQCSMILQDGKTVAINGIFRDITKRRRAEDALRLAHKELKHKMAIRTEELTEANNALTVMLRRYDQNKKQLEQHILRSLWGKISPVMERLKKSGLGESQKKYLELVEAGIIEILSPHSPGVGAIMAKLTSTEKTVANLIKRGQTTKEIAATLDIAASTVSKHRENIRKKIGITNKKQPLEKTLLSTI